MATIRTLAKVNGTFRKVIGSVDLTSFDPRSVNYAALCAQLVNPLAAVTSPNAGSSYAINANYGDVVGKDIGDGVGIFATYLGSSGGWRASDATVQDSIIRTVVQGHQDLSGPRLAILRTKIIDSFASNYRTGVTTTAALYNVLGSLTRVEISQAIDAADLIGGTYSNPSAFSTVDLCWFHAQHPYAYSGGYPWNGTTTFPLASTATGATATTGAFLTDAQQAASQAKWPVNTQVHAGELYQITVSPAAGYWTIQCVQDGTSGTGSAPGIPTVQTNGGAAGGVAFNNGGSSTPKALKDYPAGTEPSFALQGGTALWVVVGVQNHSDGMQWWQGGNTKITRTRIEGSSNAAALIQANYAPADGANVPTKNVSFDTCFFGVGTADPTTTHMVIVNCGSTISRYGTSGGSVLAGYYLWATDGTWTINPAGSRSRPWYATITNCFFDDLAAGGLPSFTQACYTSSRFNDYAIFVKDEATRDAGVAAQYGITVAQAAAMRTNPAYDWTNSTPTLVPSVLSTRLARFNAALAVPNATDGGAHQGVCDARSWIVWNSNRTASDGKQLHPTIWAGATGFDSDGYYTAG